MSTWINIEKDHPNCFQGGDFDGLKSNQILTFDKNFEIRICQCYKGVLDGSEFFDFYDQFDFEVKNVTHFMYLPEPPNN